MENLAIVSTTTNVQAKEVINGNTVNYSYNHEAGKSPLAIVFNVKRSEGTADAMTGSYFPQTNQFELKTTLYQLGDGAVQESINETCKAIVESLTPVVEPEEEQTEPE